MAGSSDYPELIDNPTQLQDGIDYMEADNVNNAYVPINKTQTFIGANGKGASWSTDILDFEANKQAPIVVKASGSTLSILAGAILIKSADQTNRLMRRNTSTVTLNAASLDTGSMAIGFYDVYVLADSAAITFTGKICLEGDTPAGAENYEKVGWFYNESGGALNIASNFVGNYKLNGRDVPNIVSILINADISTSSTSLADITGLLAKFCSSGRPVKYTLIAPLRGSDTNNKRSLAVGVDSTDKTELAMVGDNHNEHTSGTYPVTYVLQETPAAGPHSVQGRWKVSTGTGYIDASTCFSASLIVEEL